MSEYIIDSESAMQAFGEALAPKIIAPCVVHLHGDLGAGKTTLVRGILRGLGYQQKVKSPTYTLVEAYEINQQMIYHFDLYRLSDPEELEHIGFRDYLQNNAILFIEWPEKAHGFLPPAHFDIHLAIDGSRRIISMAEK